MQKVIDTVEKMVMVASAVAFLLGVVVGILISPVKRSSSERRLFGRKNTEDYSDIFEDKENMEDIPF